MTYRIWQDMENIDVQPGDWPRTSQYLDSKVRENDLMREFEAISPFLVYAQSYIFHPVRDLELPLLMDNKLFDVISIRTPSTGPLNDATDDFVKNLDLEIINMTVCYQRSGFPTVPRSDISEAVAGVQINSSPSNHKIASDTCTFIVLISWISESAMTRFKNPQEKSWASRKRELSMDWWQQSIVVPLGKLRADGADVTHECYNMCTKKTTREFGVTTWPLPSGLTEQQKQSMEEALSTSSLDEKETHKKKRTRGLMWYLSGMWDFLRKK